jgi:hypothetical protein
MGYKVPARSRHGFCFYHLKKKVPSENDSDQYRAPQVNALSEFPSLIENMESRDTLYERKKAKNTAETSVLKH